MPRISRVVVPGYAHHVTQRGTRRQDVFFCDDDRQAYLRFLAEHTHRAGVQIWAYCLMSNHVHLLAVPAQPDSLAKGIGDTHRRYTRRINFRNDWRGYLFQGRFFSCVLDEPHTLAVARYIELNPVRAGLVEQAEEYRWSSARAHLHGTPDPLIAPASPLTAEIGDWADHLAEEPDPTQTDAIRRHQRTGRPIGPSRFTEQIERLTGRQLAKKPPGPPPGTPSPKKGRKQTNHSTKRKLHAKVKSG